ncbi:hypothetical protein LUZ60_015605 [Juncus effusus]|nr:hypothetical protein LUZ60_015605 [Juncus effusus]
MAEDSSVRVQIIDQPSIASLLSPFEPHSPPRTSQSNEDESPMASSLNENARANYNRAPEKKLTIFALRLAVLEKVASGLGALGFIWATVVLLGGFAIMLEEKDFWFVTVILLIEGTRIFSRSHELEWQHQATWSLTEAGQASFRAIKLSSRLLLESFKLISRPLSINNSRIAKDVICKSNEAFDYQRNGVGPTRRTWGPCNIPINAGWGFLSRNISRLFFWLQLFSALACVTLSLMRLVAQDFGEPHEGNKGNRDSALNIFYSLAFAEALLFLAEKAFWEWKVSYTRLLEQVNTECQLGPSGLVSIKRFFYDAYSKCLNGSIFDGLKMDLVTFAEELLVSSSRDEQLIGTRILLAFSTNRRFADGTLRKIGTSNVVIERLMEMLNWKIPSEEEIRRSAAVIISKLAGKKQNALRVAGIPGSIESISSLLYTGPVTDRDFSNFNLLGLLILKKLANDHDNCGKIGNSRGLLDKIIDFTSFQQGTHIKAVKRSLQVVKMLASTTGHTGVVFRREISEIVFTTSNIRKILRYGGEHLELQRLGIEVITNLAMDGEARERIGSTGGMIKELLKLFFQSEITEEQNAVRIEAGEALTMLVMESRENCSRVLKEEGIVERFLETLEDRVLHVNSSRILRNLCAFADPEWITELSRVTAGFTMVLNSVMVERAKLLEVSLGLFAQMLKFTSSEKLIDQLHKSYILERDLINKTVSILANYENPSIKVPRIRRFVIELSIALMRLNSDYTKMYNDAGMHRELDMVANTTSELECFNVFSGSVGLSRHDVSLGSLINTALELMSRN